MTIEETTEWFVNGWEEAYARRANGFGSQIPEREHRRMMYALGRADTAQDRWMEAREPVAVKQTDGKAAAISTTQAGGEG
jgi:hypothetical protein